MVTLPSGQQVEAERMAPPDLALVQVRGASNNRLGGAVLAGWRAGQAVARRPAHSNC